MGMYINITLLGVINLTECTKMAMAMTTVGIKSTMLGSQATMVYPLN